MPYLLTNTRKLLPVLLILLTLLACREENKQTGSAVTGKEAVTKPAPLTTEESIELNRHYVRMDQERIIAQIKRMGLEMEKTGTGLWYRILEEGAERNIQEGDVVSIEYRMNDLMNGELYYDSRRDGLKSFTVGHGNVESGLEEGILLLKLNSRALFIMPPSLAYGLTGDGSKIPSRTTLLYEIKVVAVD
ncbi:MAG: FKBP-type peptidyl-prolyl cis-trans isomerase [Bacteroidales bacterium]|nr:FKBP-type peptidyl-prolyl cis-trans isomerase [Bacteroidales bacterium]